MALVRPRNDTAVAAESCAGDKREQGSGAETKGGSTMVGRGCAQTGRRRGRWVSPSPWQIEVGMCVGDCERGLLSNGCVSVSPSARRARRLRCQTLYSSDRAACTLRTCCLFIQSPTVCVSGTLSRGLDALYQGRKHGQPR
eukprot:TRINITY_DN2156_c0_g1_i3.p2 TRINITY_DN2156_c0_g1~~TRINITY_DN2156_c0_g1_i3.p2  ORF type:complete len:141 (+),score=7.55 TRINITY_DN2156_c0_g1_i3:736-1158(+)